MEEKEKEKFAKKLEEMLTNGTAGNLIRYLIASTFAEQAKMTEDEYLKFIGFDGKGVSEDKAIRIALSNVLIETMKLKLKNQDTLKSIIAVLKIKGEENGK